jgi:hypothetical protein
MDMILQLCFRQKTLCIMLMHILLNMMYPLTSMMSMTKAITNDGLVMYLRIVKTVLFWLLSNLA